VKPNALMFLRFFSLAVGTSAEAGETDSSQQLFTKCRSSCHGMDGRGNGTVTPYLKIKVPDLTLLKEK
jgi:hypothetical protein